MAGVTGCHFSDSLLQGMHSWQQQRQQQQQQQKGAMTTACSAPPQAITVIPLFL
jgi:hypothetical protein